jgi:hypothetical protein
MATRSQTTCLTVVLMLLVAAAGVQGHASSKLRGILGRDAPGSGQTQCAFRPLGGYNDVDMSMIYDKECLQLVCYAPHSRSTQVHAS